MAYTNSSLISLKKISPHRNSPRNHAIDTVTIHCYVGQASIESMASWFSSAGAQCSCNYGIGSDGRIVLICEEKDRSWCSSSPPNDNRAITIECASDSTHPYAINDKVYKSLINLLADICKRNDIKQLLWKADKSLIGNTAKQNMTVHRWFDNKACPGDYLYNRHSQIANEVNAKLGTSTGTQTGTIPNAKIGDSSVDEVAKICYNEAGVIQSYDALVAVAQCIHDMSENGGYGNGITAIMKNNFAAYGKQGTSEEARKAAYDVFINGKRRFSDAKILQFRSFTNYSDGNGNMDKTKCADLLKKYEYLGKDARNNQWGHLYFGKKTNGGSTAGGTSYTVQVGSFSVKINADNYCEKVKQKGFDAIVKLDNGQYKVQCGVFTYKQNAENLKKALITAGFDAIVK